MITLLPTAFLPFLSTSYLNFTSYCNRMSLFSHLHRRSIQFFLFKLFLNNTHVLLDLMGQTSVDRNQTETSIIMQRIFLFLHLYL